MVITYIDTGNGRECVSDDGESSRLRLRAFEDENEGPMVAIDECDAESSTWMNICNSQSTEDSIFRICDQLTGKIAIQYSTEACNHNNNYYGCPYPY